MKNYYMTLAQRLVFTVLAAAFLVIAGTGCNTTRGVGEDVERAGEEIQDAVQ